MTRGTMKRLLLLAAILCGSVAAAEDIQTLLGKQQQAFEQDLATIQATSTKEQETRAVEYVQALKSLQQKFQKAGDLDSVLAAQGEEKRFATAKLVSEDVVVKAVPALADLQTRVIKAAKNIELNRCKQIVARADKYIADLQELKKNLTKQEQITEAMKVNEEIGQVRNRAEVTAAEFTLADARSATPTAPANTEPPETVTEQSAAWQKLSKGLVLYYPFDRDEGGKVTDKSGRKNDGEVHGAKWTPKGKAGGAYTFDGSGDYVDVPDSPALRVESVPFTISLWLKPNIVRKQEILFKGPTAFSGGYILAMNRMSNDITLTKGNATDQLVPYLFQAGKWFHLVAVQGRTSVEYFINGSSIGTYRDSTAYVSSSTHPLRIGGGNTFMSQFSGQIADVRIYNRALTEKEVKQLYDLNK